MMFMQPLCPEWQLAIDLCYCVTRAVTEAATPGERSIVCSVDVMRL